MHASRFAPPGAKADTLFDSEAARTWAALVAYLVVALVFTWPLARGLTKDVPSDMGDSLLNMWILSWDAEQLRRLFSGELSVLYRWFDGNIFYPVPDSLAYSEHLIPQAIQIFPVYLLTRNPILCYNLLFLSTYVLSGLGTYLLVRELTHDRRAAFVAGLIFGFIPYRIPQASHLQILSSQWMPFTLYGLTRYLNTGRRSALAGGAAALVIQGLSCGYYLIYFSPFAAGYVVWELVRRWRLKEWRTWGELTTAAGICAVVLTPFLLPYARVQANLQLTRRIEEVGLYSADVYAYLTAFPIQRFWGPRLQTLPRGEGELFMGAVPLLLGILGMMLLLIRAWRAGSATEERRPLASAVLGLIAFSALAVSIAAVFMRRLSWEIAGVPLRVTDIGRPLILSALAVSLCLLISARARARFRALGTVEGFFLLAIVAGWWLSLGPTPTAFKQSLELPAPYRLLYLLPGVDGLRVPARLAMGTALMLAVVAGFVIARLPRRRIGTFLMSVIIIAFLAEAPSSEFPLNGVTRTPGFGMPDARVFPPATAPPVYRAISRLKGRVVLLELPIGDFNWDVRAAFYSTAHWRPVVNGYSGFFPPHYPGLISRFGNLSREPDQARVALADSGATHVLVHDQGFSASDAAETHRWLEASGAREVARNGGDFLYDIRRR